MHHACQISTAKEDFLIDTIALHDEMGILRPVFADPSICKVCLHTQLMLLFVLCYDMCCHNQCISCHYLRYWHLYICKVLPSWIPEILSSLLLKLIYLFGYGICIFVVGLFIICLIASNGLKMRCLFVQEQIYLQLCKFPRDGY
jgi:hypothetical protein